MKRIAGPLARLPDALPLLALLAAALARFLPTSDAASAVDPLLAALVLVTALGIEPARLKVVRARARLVGGLAVLPLLVLGLLGWAVSVVAGGAAGTGVLAVGLSPTEVASVGLIGLMGGAAELAIAVLAASLAVSAVLAPPLLGALAPGSHAVDVAALLGRFALVVLAPLGAGLGVRALLRGWTPDEEALAVPGSLLVVGLVYASLGGSKNGLGADVAVSAVFLALSVAVALAAVVAGGRRLDPTLGLTIAMRDFAVAAALAATAGGPAAARVAGVYGVLMLLGGAGVTGVVRARARRASARAGRRPAV